MRARTREGRASGGGSRGGGGTGARTRSRRRRRGGAGGRGGGGGGGGERGREDDVGAGREEEGGVEEESVEGAGAGVAEVALEARDAAVEVEGAVVGVGVPGHPRERTDGAREGDNREGAP